MATTFSGGTSAWMLWTVQKTKPPPGASASTLRRTSSATSAGVPRGSMAWVSTPPPQNDTSFPKSRFSATGSMPAAVVCTGFRTSMPISMKSGRIFRTLPQEWKKTKASGAPCFIARTSSARRGLKKERKVAGETSIDCCVP